jgi:hypothetical protein
MSCEAKRRVSKEMSIASEAKRIAAKSEDVEAKCKRTDGEEKRLALPRSWFISGES